MKKSIILGVSLLLLAGCSQTKPATTNETMNSGTNMSGENPQAIVQPATAVASIAGLNVKDGLSCGDAIKAYLEEAKKQKVDDAKVVSATTPVVVDYIGRLSDNEIFDTNVESVAKACNNYDARKPYTQGLPFTPGEKGMIVGFAEGVQGLKLGETKTITFGSEKGYGERSDKNITEVSTDKLPPLPNGQEYQVGDKVPSMIGELEIKAMSGKNLMIDTNHPLAGKTLIFDVTVRGIK